jgi:hypothetical protein
VKNIFLHAELCRKKSASKYYKGEYYLKLHNNETKNLSARLCVICVKNIFLHAELCRKKSASKYCKGSILSKAAE